MTEARRLVDKLWSYCNVLRDDGVSTIEYTEHQAMVDCLQPSPADTVIDPAAGTVGFLLGAHEYASQHAEDMTPEECDHLRDGTARLAAMNLIEVKDALLADPGQRSSSPRRTSSSTSSSTSPRS